MSYQLPESEKKYNFCGCQCGCPPETPAKPRAFSCDTAKEPVRTIKVLDTEEFCMLLSRKKHRPIMPICRLSSKMSGLYPRGNSAA